MQKKGWIFWVFLMILSIALLGGCSDDSSGGGNGGDDNNGDSEGKCLIWAYMGAYSEIFYAQIWASDTNGVSPTQCSVTVNGLDIPYIGTLDGTDAYFACSPLQFDYEPETEYTITVQLDSKTAVCNFTSPGASDINGVSPPDYSNFTPGEDIELVWELSGETADEINIMVTTAEEEDPLLQELLSGTVTSYTISGATTNGWADYDQIGITVDLGEFAYLFTGELAEVTSATFIVLPGYALELYNEDDTTHIPTDTTWYVSYIELSDYYLNADGLSTTLVTAQVESEYGNPCPDGTPVTFSDQPDGMVSFDPEVATTVGGVATSTITAGTSAGDVNIIATALDASNFTQLFLTEIIDIEVSVGDGAFPVITWTPNTLGLYGIMIRKTGIGVGNMRWAIIMNDIDGFLPPITYGTPPSDAEQTYPLAGNPDSLEIGEEYLLGAIKIGATSDTVFHTFTRTAK